MSKDQRASKHEEIELSFIVYLKSVAAHAEAVIKNRHQVSKVQLLTYVRTIKESSENVLEQIREINTNERR